VQQRCSDEQRWRTRCTARCRGAEVLSGCRGRWCRGVAVVQSGTEVEKRWCWYAVVPRWDRGGADTVQKG